MKGFPFARMHAGRRRCSDTDVVKGLIISQRLSDKVSLALRAITTDVTYHGQTRMISVTLIILIVILHTP
jgi:hypothetical protein